MVRVTRIISTRVLGDTLNQFIGQAMQMTVHKKEDNIIDFIDGNDEAKRLLRSIKRIASEVLMSVNGKFKVKSIESLYNNYNYKVVCMEKDNKGVWLTAGIETRLGIIIFD